MAFDGPKGTEGKLLLVAVSNLEQTDILSAVMSAVVCGRAFKRQHFVANINIKVQGTIRLV